MAFYTTAAITAAGTIYTAKKQSDAAKGAARVQSESADRAMDSNERMLQQSLEFRQPFVDASLPATNALSERLTNPATRADIVNDDLYKSLFGNATRQITAANAARGKLQSGDTLNDLTTASLGLGSNIYNQRTNDLYNLAALGSNAAAGQATNTMITAGNQANLLTGQGNVLAAGRIGSANAITSGVNDLLGLSQLALRRFGNGGV